VKSTEGETISGPTPLYRPRFPPLFVEQAQCLVRQRTVAYQLQQRAQLVLLLEADPVLSNSRAGAEVHLHPNTVRYWRRRWDLGEFFLADAPGRGRKSVFPPLEQALVKAVAREAVHQSGLPLSRLSTADIAGQARKALGKAISTSTVWRILAAGHLPSTTPHM